MNFEISFEKKLSLASESKDEDTLFVLANDGDCRIRETVAGNTATNASVLDKLSKDIFWRVRARVASNRNTDAKTLRWLGKDESSLVRLTPRT